jgi:iron(III) transport system substrate-binding protein
MLSRHPITSRPLSRREFALAALGLAFPFTLAGCQGSKPRVVLYCAQDQEFAEESFTQFSKRYGIEVAPKFDTEKDKSVSLYTELLHEKDRPRCDVFWNNEPLSTIRLQRQELLEPYDSPSARPYPASAKAADHTWHAFAERARVLLVNTDRIPEAERPRSLLDLTAPRWKGQVAMAKPLFGSSSTQATCLFEVLGPEQARNYYRGLRQNGVHIVGGNKDVAVGVGEGRFAVGITDTDDAIAEVKDGRHVALIFPDRDRPRDERMGTLFFPNTVAVVKGSPNPDAARKLIDYLLSAEVETRLAESASHQIPLNPEVKARLPEPIEAGRTAKAMQVDFAKAADLWDEAQTFLDNEIVRP